MNASLADTEARLNALKAGVGTLPAETQVAVCVPAPYLFQVQASLQGSAIGWGAQDLSTETQGAYTGEVSASMLQDFGCQWVLVGHSERRARHAESSQAVAQKAQQALQHGLTPVFCVGETELEQDSGDTAAVIQAQLAPLLALGQAACQQTVVAYEPVWAIGTGKSATPQQAQAVHALIRQLLVEAGAGGSPILYGGSVNASNAAELFAMPDIDGALVGGAALKPEEFLRIAAS